MSIKGPFKVQDLDSIATKNHRKWVFIIAYGGVLGGFLAITFSRWGYDDPYITYRYAKNISAGIGFVYNSGENILSTTTPLFTLLLGGLHFFSIDIPTAATLVGSFSLAFGALLLWDLAISWGKPISGLVALIVYPFFPLLLSTLGSEMALSLLFGIGAFSMYARENYKVSAIFAALAFLTRPDAGLIALILFVDYMVRKRRALPWSSILVFSAITGPWIVYAIYSFGSPIPVTLAAKQHQGSMAVSLTFIPGLLKIIRQSYAGNWQYWAAPILAGIGVFSLAKRDRRWFFFLSWPAFHAIAFIVLGVSGYFWYYAALVPGFIVLIGAGIDVIYKSLRDKGIFAPHGARVSVGIGLMLVVTPMIFQGLQVRSHPDPRLGIYEEVGNWLRENTEPDSSVGALEVGIIGYYGEREMVDFAGIIQPAIAAQLGPSSTYEDAAIWGTQRYQPDFVVLNSLGYPRLLEEIVKPRCHSEEEFVGIPYGYEGNLIVYHCDW